MTAEYNVGMFTAHLTVLDHLLGDAGHHLRSLDATLTSRRHRPARPGRRR